MADPKKELPADLVKFRDSYVELFGTLPPLPKSMLSTRSLVVRPPLGPTEVNEPSLLSVTLPWAGSEPNRGCSQARRCSRASRS